MASAVPAFPFTKETTNYARLCRLLVDVGSHVLRETLDRVHPPASLYTVLAGPAVQTALQKLRTKKVLNPTQWGRLYPAIKSSVSSREFDITLLTVLLRNICGLTPPNTGWDSLPSATAVTTEADIARVKFYRNTVYGHAIQASIDDATFDKYWTEIREALVRLGGADYGTAIDDLRDECMDPDIEEHYMELLKEWKKDEDNIQDKLDEILKTLDDLKQALGCCRKSPQEQAFLEECQAHLRAHYDTMSQVKVTPWNPEDTVEMNEIYTNLSWVRDERKCSGKVQRKLGDYTEMFDRHNRYTKHNRMFVYGRPGIGKSTFSKKIAVDWAIGEKEALKRFELLFFISLQNISGKMQDFLSILKASKLFSKDSSISMENLYEYVLQNQDKVLFVFDGYDEYSVEGPSIIRDIWKGNQLRDCHVMVTTRQMEGDELRRFSHLQLEIKGFDSIEQVNEFASKFFNDQREIEEFDRYLYDRDLWDVAEIPLLLLMLCLIWKERRRKAYPKSRLELFERFIATMLQHMTSKGKDKAYLWNILDYYRDELTKIGKLALDALLRNTSHIDHKDLSMQGGVPTGLGEIIHSGLFQFSKSSSDQANMSLFFLHKSIQEFLAAWYIMNEAGLKEGKVDCFTRIDSFQQVLKLVEILKFMCEWSAEGARAVFSLLQFIGEKEGLTECIFSKTPSMDDLSRHQRQFRDISLECFVSCSAAVKRDVSQLFLSSVGGMVLFKHSMGKFSAAILDALHAVIVTCSGHRLKAFNYLFQKHYVGSELPRLNFLLKKEEETVYLYFTEILLWDDYPSNYLEMLRNLTAPSPECQTKQYVTLRSNDQDNSYSTCNVTEYAEDTRGCTKNCFSLVSEISWTGGRTSKELTILSDSLPAVAFLKKIEVTQPQYRLFDAQVVRNVVSHINFNDNLSVLELQRLNMTADDGGVIAKSLHQAPNLRVLNLSDSSLHGSLTILAKNLRHLPLLSDLTLFRVGMDYEECESLGTSLQYVLELKSLDLSCNPLRNGITKLAEHLKFVPSLVSLYLNKTNMGEEEVTALARNLKNVPNLNLFALSGNPLGHGVSLLMQHLSSLAVHDHRELDFGRRIETSCHELDLQGVLMTQKQLDDINKIQLGCYIKTSYHDHQGNLLPKHAWPKIHPVPKYLLSPMLGKKQGYF